VATSGWRVLPEEAVQALLAVGAVLAVLRRVFLWSPVREAQVGGVGLQVVEGLLRRLVFLPGLAVAVVVLVTISWEIRL
jgi:hypothetical protein